MTSKSKPKIIKTKNQNFKTVETTNLYFLFSGAQIGEATKSFPMWWTK